MKDVQVEFGDYILEGDYLLKESMVESVEETLGRMVLEVLKQESIIRQY